MKTKMNKTRTRLLPMFSLASALCCSQMNLTAGTAVIYSNNFESYTNAATSLSSTNDADPAGVEWSMADDTALLPTTVGAGVQVINWLTNAAGAPNQALLLRPNSEAQIFLNNAKSGSRYQLDFSTFAVREPTSSQNFYVVLRAEGADSNGDDYLAYRVDRVTNSTALYYYDGVGPGAAAWTALTNKNTGLVATQTTNQWQHHRIIIDPNALTFSIYIDDMVTPVNTGLELSRCDVAAPVAIRLLNEGNTADDGYYAIDDITLTVEDSKDLSSVITEGFETYPARVASDDNANPQGPWITTEVDGTGAGRLRAPAKVQVVDSSVVAPHSGTKCLKLEAGQRAGASIAWGVAPQSDVQITWWARVPASVKGQQANYLRFSLYGAEGGNTYSGDCALLGYGSRDGTIGDETSLTYYTTAWVDTTVDYTPDVWEEYRLTTHNSQGRYTIIKSPSSPAAKVIVDRSSFVGTAATWGPTFMAAWSSSNGTNHPPVYVDDIKIETLVSNPSPLPEPYTAHIDGSRFTNFTKLTVSGPAGAMAIDPRDNTTIVFAIDAAAGGSINKATKVAGGNWAIDPVPLVAGIANPSGLTIAADGTIWWVHDFAMGLWRLKAPWNANVPERVIADFALSGAITGGVDDDPFDVAFTPANFTGSVGAPNQIVVMDRGVDGDANNALFTVDPTTTTLDQTMYSQYLFGPGGLGAVDLVGMTVLPQSAEMVTLNFDGQITAVDANGMSRSFWPDFYSDIAIAIAPSSIAADPQTGRLWVADDLTNQVWSCTPDGISGQRELSFPLTDAGRPDRQIDFQEPGMKFSPDGKFLVVSDTSTANGGGRFFIFHNEAIEVPPFKISTVLRAGAGVQLSWQAAGSVKYNVLRASSLVNASSFTNISGDISGTSYTDTNAVPAGAFYRVVAKP